MRIRPLLFGGIVPTVLLVLFVTGCAKKVPVLPEARETEMVSSQETSSTMPSESEQELAARLEREKIKESERRVMEESMRRPFGAPAKTTPPSMSQEEFVNRDVNFAYDSFTLSSDAKALLEKKATWLAENPYVTVQIEGHCDERGTTAYNLALGERRANTVKQYLVALGIDVSRLSTISYGEETPLDPGHDEAAWKRNRRAHFVISGQ